METIPVPSPKPKQGYKLSSSNDLKVSSIMEMALSYWSSAIQRHGCTLLGLEICRSNQTHLKKKIKRRSNMHSTNIFILVFYFYIQLKNKLSNLLVDQRNEKTKLVRSSNSKPISWNWVANKNKFGSHTPTSPPIGFCKVDSNNEIEMA